jgi:hypothetical protein
VDPPSPTDFAKATTVKKLWRTRSRKKKGKPFDKLRVPSPVEGVERRKEKG